MLFISQSHLIVARAQGLAQSMLDIHHPPIILGGVAVGRIKMELYKTVTPKVCMYV